jgi:hypothetical protein
VDEHHHGQHARAEETKKRARKRGGYITDQY